MSIDKPNTTIVTLKSLTSEYTATSVRSSPDKAQEQSRGTFNNHNGVVVNGLLVSSGIQRMTTPENIWKTQAISFFLFMHFCPGTITTHAESINSDLQRGLDRRLRHTQH